MVYFNFNKSFEKNNLKSRISKRNKKIKKFFLPLIRLKKYIKARKLKNARRMKFHFFRYKRKIKYFTGSKTFAKTKKNYKFSSSFQSKFYFRRKFFKWLRRFIFKRRITSIFKVFYIYRKIKIVKRFIKPTKEKRIRFTNFLIKYRKFVLDRFKFSVPNYFKTLNSKIKYLRYLFNRRRWKFKSKLYIRRRQLARNKFKMIFFNYKRFSIKVPQSTKLRKVKDIHFFKGFKKFWSLKSSFSGNSTYKFFFLNDLGNLESSPFLIKNSKFFNYFNSNPPPPLIKRIPKYFYTTKKYKKIYSPKLKFFRSFRKTIFFFKVYRKKSRYHRYKRFYRYKNIRNRFRFFASQQNLSKNSQISILSSFIVKKKKAKFLPFLGFFSKFGRVFYKFRRKRIKFKKFFKKYFRLFRSFSGTTTKKFKKIRKHFSSIKLYLHIFRSINNIFVNLSAPKGRSVYVYSAGRTFYKGSKRLSPIAVETMGKNISNIFKASKIDNIYLVFHCPIDYLCRSLMRGISRNIKFSGFSYYLNKPHNGLRKRSTRRV